MDCAIERLRAEEVDVLWRMLTLIRVELEGRKV